MGSKKQMNVNPTLCPSTDDLNNPAYYINRELSWLQFNARVLEEAMDQTHPLLERVKFLAIFANNLDEFFMIRVSGLLRQLEAGALSLPPDGLNPAEQLILIKQELQPLLEQQINCWRNDLFPKLNTAGIAIRHYHELTNPQRKALRHYFEKEIFPTLTPLATDPGHPFPLISNLSLNLAVVIKDVQFGERFARLKIPDTFPRLLKVIDNESTSDTSTCGIGKIAEWVWIEDVITANLDMLFPGLEVESSYLFRVTRDADLEIEEDEASDLLTCIQEGIEMRRFGTAVRLEVSRNMPKVVREILSKNLHLQPDQIYSLHNPIGIVSLMEITKLNRPDLKDPPFQPAIPGNLAVGESIFAAIRRRNLILYHPYDSFAPVTDFITEAARDPKVLAIKQTLYRVGKNSPVVDALMEARENGKQVAVLVELKARFDEENNIGWAQALERAGVHVVYGLVGIKTHAKMCLVVRKEADKIIRYVHLGTGNYNPITSRLYSDFSYFTCNPAVGNDVSHLFNAITGYSHKVKYRKLLVAPHSLRINIIERIEREIAQHRKHHQGYLAFKMNSLVDKECIQALYRASQAGVKIDLQIRSICCLRPGIPGLSENITVTSIVGRFLEHPRMYYFYNDGKEELLMGSADLMPRNLDRRIEILFPVEGSRLRKILSEMILKTHLQDNVKARELFSDGHYEKIAIDPNQIELNSQHFMLENCGFWNHGTAAFDDALQKFVAATRENHI